MTHTAPTFGDPHGLPTNDFDAARPAGPDLLVGRGMTMRFGGLTAVDSVDFTIPQGQVVSLIGPNGAGKTTFFNMLTGLYQPSDGELTFMGTDIFCQPPHRIAQLGMSRTFQNIRLFREMSMVDNVLVGMHHQLKGGIVSTLLRLPSFRREERDAVNAARRLLIMVGLTDRHNDLAGNLPLRRPAAARDCPRARIDAQRAAARRASRRHEPAGDRRPRLADSLDP